jgi:hypothetical protein
MKKINIILYATILLVILISSCRKLDTFPADEIDSSKALITISDFQSALNGVYASLKSPSYYGEDIVALTTWASDEMLISPQNTGQGQFLYRWDYVDNDQDISADWAAMYNTIYRANVILEKIEGLETNSSIEESQKNQINGEALAVRALAHFDLLRLYADRYDKTVDASHLGVPFVTSTSPTNTPPRNTVSEVTNNIISDLNTSVTLMNTPNNTAYYFTAIGAKALLARVYLYKKDYSNAISLATDVINNSGLSLSSGTSYSNMFNSTENRGEIIFRIAMIAGDNEIGDAFHTDPVSGGITRFYVSPKLSSLYDNSDVRKNVNLYVPAGDSILCGKYLGSSARRGLSTIKVLRLSEMYLIRAEANLFRSAPDEPSASNDINTIRTARITGYVNTPLSGSALYTALNEEIFKEFAFEGYRWFYLKRNNLSVDRNPYCGSNYCELPAGNFRFTWPIPIDEIQANNNMLQNQGY